MLPAEPDLPIRAVLPELSATLASHRAAVLVAPPGTGKTTLVPLALADAVPGRVVVAEPRRVAARAAARRMAALLGEPVGRTVGYAVRGDRRVGPDTRVEVVTTGLLVRRMQHAEDLPGVAAVVLDECHERSLDSDLALAFGADIRATLREDLLLVATSATADVPALTAALPAPVVEARAALHPVRTVWCPPPAPVPPPHGMHVDPRLLDHVAATVRTALAETTGDVLVFLPGAAEIAGVRRRLGTVDADVRELHGRAPAAAQDAVLRPADHRRVVLATAVAESSLTVPGVRVVVDAGLARVPRTDLARGLGALATVPVSRAAAEQRAGRAGRQAPGTVYRCWSQATHERLPARPEPEIATADLTGFALHLACWGAPDGAGLALPDPPPPAALAVARTTLRSLGAVDDAGRATDRGRRLAAVGTHPRLARALLDGAPLVGADTATEVVALLGEEVRGDSDDLTAVRRALRTGSGPETARWRAEVRRLAAALPGDAPPTVPGPADAAAGLLVGLAFPERLARARRDGDRAYLMAGGTAAELAPGSGLRGCAWLAVAVADRPAGAASARVRLAAAIDVGTARRAGAALLSTAERTDWYDGDVRAARVESLGAITLDERPLADPDPAAVRDALLTGLRTAGLGLLRWTDAARSLRARLAFCRRALGPPWPDVSDAALSATLPDWLGPALRGARRRADLAAVDVADALRALLPWPAAARFDELAPERVTVPSGSRIRVDYGDPEAPVLAVRVQEVFGWTDTPRLAGVPVRLHLLSPAGRPAAVTGDLASFWRTGYPAVRAELRGRYPRHPWPADPTTAEPTRRAKPRR